MAQALIRIFLLHSSLAGLVVFAERLNPIPSRTRPLNFPAPMVLSLKAWKSRSLPGLPRTRSPQHDDNLRNGRRQWRPFCFRELPSENGEQPQKHPRQLFAKSRRPKSHHADTRRARFRDVAPSSRPDLSQPRPQARCRSRRFSRGFMAGPRNRSFCALPIALRRCYIAPETRGQCTALRVLARGGAAR
jgi:hypothetical protein